MRSGEVGKWVRVVSFRGVVSLRVSVRMGDASFFDLPRRSALGCLFFAANLLYRELFGLLKLLFPLFCPSVDREPWSFVVRLVELCHPKVGNDHLLGRVW